MRITILKNTSQSIWPEVTGLRSDDLFNLNESGMCQGSSENKLAVLARLGYPVAVIYPVNQQGKTLAK